jgi:hypothetical protein
VEKQELSRFLMGLFKTGFKLEKFWSGFFFNSKLTYGGLLILPIWYQKTEQGTSNIALNP